MPELKHIPCDNWEDADVGMCLIPVCLVRLFSLSPHQQWDTRAYSDGSQEKKQPWSLESWMKASGGLEE
jgi:hypothetical protein